MCSYGQIFRDIFTTTAAYDACIPGSDFLERQPASSALYASFRRNPPHPASDMDFAMAIAYHIPDIQIFNSDKTVIIYYISRHLVLKIRPLVFHLAVQRCNSEPCFILFDDPFFFLERSFCLRISFFSDFVRYLGLSIIVPSDSTAKDFTPTSML